MRLWKLIQKLSAFLTIEFTKIKQSHFQRNMSVKELINCSENMRTFYAICDKTVSMCDLITPKAEKLTNFRHFGLKVSVCSASAVGASENF